MHSSSSNNNEQLTSLKSAYFEAFRDFKECQTEEAFLKFHASVDAILKYTCEYIDHINMVT
jgi:hypothetical protein